jgi:hypothetical protein
MNMSSLEARESQAFGLMGRLHVLLRREIGRVTDIKYMSTNPEYCAHVLELAFAVANPDLHAISERLEEIYFGENGLFENSPLRPLRGAAPMVKALAVSPPAVELSADEDQHYVGRLR